jgi:TolB protein
MNMADATLAGTSLPSKVFVASDDVDGGIYYWALAAGDGSPEGIYRHDMQRPGQAPEEFFTRRQTSGRCVGCHALSRDGTKMAVTLYDIDGSPDSEGVGTVLDVGSRQLDLADRTFQWNFAAFGPQSDRLVTIFRAAWRYEAQPPVG